MIVINLFYKQFGNPFNVVVIIVFRNLKLQKLKTRHVIVLFSVEVALWKS